MVNIDRLRIEEYSLDSSFKMNSWQIFIDEGVEFDSMQQANCMFVSI